jgi:DNA (cytosine-5)-methyltransferase 1
LIDGNLLLYKYHGRLPFLHSLVMFIRKDLSSILSSANKLIVGCTNLTLTFAEIVNHSLPTWFVMENVDRSINSATCSEAREIFHKAGYGLTETTLDASYCGVPQKRKRFFCIGKLNEDDGFLLTTIQSKLAKSPMTIRHYLGNDLGLTHYYRHPRNYCRRAVFSIDEPSATIRGVNRPIPKGYPGHPNDEVPVDNLRPLTTLERARLQTFPKEYAWLGSKTEMEQLIGNAVPVNLAKFVGECVLSHEHRFNYISHVGLTAQSYSRTY